MEKQFKVPEKWYILKNNIKSDDWKIVADYFNKGCNVLNQQPISEDHSQLIKLLNDAL